MKIVCPECGGAQAYLSWKAFVSQTLMVEDGALVPVPYTSEDVHGDDGPEWYCCLDCGYETDDGNEFLREEDE